MKSDESFLIMVEELRGPDTKYRHKSSRGFVTGGNVQRYVNNLVHHVANVHDCFSISH